MKYLLAFVIFLAPTALFGVALAQNAADACYDPADMAEARAALKKGTSGGSNILLMVDRLEYQTGGAESVVWVAQGWFGGDRNKLWIKSEGDYDLQGNTFEEAQVQALYSRAISTFFDLQMGLRQDVGSGPNRTYGVIGIQGLAPYWFELDTAAFVSDKGDVTVRVEAEYEILLTQRLVLQPRVEFNFAFQNVEELGIGSGLSTIEAALRLRFEIKREFAPYIGVSRSRAFGNTADFARIEGQKVSGTSLVLGIRAWF